MKSNILRSSIIAAVLALFLIVQTCDKTHAGVHSVTLTWNAAVPPAGATWLPSGYNIYRGTTPGGYTIGTHINSAAVAGVTFTDTTVASGTTYYYNATTWCQTCDVGQQESAFAGEIKVVIPKDVVGPPNPPTAFAAPTVQ